MANSLGAEESGLGSIFPSDSKESAPYAWYVVAALHGLYICSFLDRQLIAVLVEPMRRDLHLSDTTIGLIQGLGFAILYSVVGVPIGRLVDRFSRKWIIVGGVLIWSAMTALSGLAQTTATLFFARTAVGIGEATLSPSAYSMVSDLFSKGKLGRAMSVYALGSTIGGGLAVIFGGMMVGYLQYKPPIPVPFIGHIFAWQLTYFIVGLPGLALAALFVLTVREPKRRDLLRGVGGTPARQLSIREALAFMRPRRLTYVLLFGGHALSSLAGYAAGAWIVTFFVRIHRWDISRVAEILGPISLISSLIGPYFAGWMADRLYDRGSIDISVRISAYTMFALAVLAVLTPLAPSAFLALALIALSGLISSFLVGLPLASVQMITPNQLRGQVSAVFLFVVNIIGIGLGATSVGFVTDHIFGYDGALKYSLAIIPSIALAAGGVMLLFCCAPFRKSVASAKAWAG